MVDRADVYIGIFARRYGWIPDDKTIAQAEKELGHPLPRGISITEMEFQRAHELKKQGHLKEILIFEMHDDHPLKFSEVEADAPAQQKLQNLKKTASQFPVHAKFKSAEEFRSHLI